MLSTSPARAIGLATTGSPGTVATRFQALPLSGRSTTGVPCLAFDGTGGGACHDARPSPLQERPAWRSRTRGAGSRWADDRIGAAAIMRLAAGSAGVTDVMRFPRTYFAERALTEVGKCVPG
jgi:hypothetical protein